MIFNIEVGILGIKTIENDKLFIRQLLKWRIIEIDFEDEKQADDFFDWLYSNRKKNKKCESK